MSVGTQEQLVARQFGAQAGAYLTSLVHAQGDDLAAIAAIVRERAAAGLGVRTLDLGCGGGHAAYAAAQHGASVTAYDLSHEMLAVVAAEAARRGLAIETVQGVVERLEFADGAFDIVLSRYSAHHWRDFAAGVGEASRVLRSSGVAAFVDVVSPGRPALDTFLNAVELLRDTSHVQDRTVAEWLAAAAAAGLVAAGLMPARLRLEFASWTERIGTPAPLATAIRVLQQAASDAVAKHFAIEPDGSFTVDTALLRFGKP